MEFQSFLGKYLGIFRFFSKYLEVFSGNFFRVFKDYSGVSLGISRLMLAISTIVFV